jgi:hypothetical protein
MTDEVVVWPGVSLGMSMYGVEVDSLQLGSSRGGAKL